MLQTFDEKPAEKIHTEVEEFILNGHAPGCTRLFYKLFFQSFSDPHFSLTEDEKLSMESLSDLLLSLMEAKSK